MGAYSTISAQAASGVQISKEYIMANGTTYYISNPYYQNAILDASSAGTIKFVVYKDGNATKGCYVAKNVNRPRIEYHAQDNISGVYSVNINSESAHDETTGLYYAGEYTFNNQISIALPDIHNSLREALDACNDGYWPGYNESVTIPIPVVWRSPYSANQYRTTFNIYVNESNSSGAAGSTDGGGYSDDSGGSSSGGGGGF